MLTFKYFLPLFLIFTFETLYSKMQDYNFMDKISVKSANITDYKYKDTIKSECGLIRLSNDKVVFMTRQNGEMKPFFIKAIETGYWDTRYEPNTNYDSVFSDMKSIGANTAFVMIHWEDIETSDNCFDFSFADMVTSAAKRQGLKINWVLFLHTQHNGVPPCGAENAWTFNLDNRDSCNYTMQWPKQGAKIYKNVKSLVENGGIRPLHVYGHPEIFVRIKRLMRKIAQHYRYSDTVIGVQLGNEEGFSFLDESDFNPITKQLYEIWKTKTNKTDYNQFKKEAINWWWKQFTTSYHKIDPYKILSFNLDAGQAEAGDRNRVNMTGTSAATYADGNLDAIGTMFYNQWGYKAILGLDERYNESSYNFKLPILIPSEIGIGKFNKPEDFNSFVMHTLERAAQGFGVYCYGEVRKELPDSISAREVLKSMFSNISMNEKIIFSGLPGPGNVTCTISDTNMQISHLNAENEGTLAMIYTPTLSETEQNIMRPESLKINISSEKNGIYEANIIQSGKLIKTYILKLTKNITKYIVLDKYKKTEPIFVNIRIKQ